MFLSKKLKQNYQSDSYHFCHRFKKKCSLCCHLFVKMIILAKYENEIDSSSMIF